MEKYYIPELKIIICIPTREELTEEPDTWWGLIEHEDGYGIDYNWCVEEVDDEMFDNSALYACYWQSAGNYLETDHSYYVPYVINFENEAWTDELLKMAIKFLMHIMEEDKDE